MANVSQADWLALMGFQGELDPSVIDSFHDTAALLDEDPSKLVDRHYLERSDGAYAIYPASHTAIYGEPGSGKTMLAKFAAAQALRKGGKVAHIDLDDNLAAVVAHDVLNFGADKQSMIDSWKLAQPDSIERLNALWERLEAGGYDLVIIDSMAALEGYTAVDANTSLDFVQRIYLPYVKRLMLAGISVISIDHTGKDTDKKGAMGSTQKLAKSDLALHVVVPEGAGLTPGELGHVTIYVDKDRYGATKADAQLREYRNGHMRPLWGTFTIPGTGLKDARIQAPRFDAPNKVHDPFHQSGF